MARMTATEETLFVGMILICAKMGITLEEIIRFRNYLRGTRDHGDHQQATPPTDTP